MLTTIHHDSIVTKQCRSRTAQLGWCGVFCLVFILATQNSAESWHFCLVCKEKCFNLAFNYRLCGKQMAQLICARQNNEEVHPKMHRSPWWIWESKAVTHTVNMVTLKWQLNVWLNLCAISNVRCSITFSPLMYLILTMLTVNVQCLA